MERAAERIRARAFPIRWVRPEGVHVTLKFLGEVVEGRVPEVTSAVESGVADLSPFRMEARGFGAFPTPRRPRVVWIGVEPSEALRTLQARVERALETLGFAPEGRPFHPHLTLGRAKAGARAADFRGLAELMEELEYEATFEVRCIDVMRSKLTPRGAIYDVVHSAELGGDRGAA